KPAGALDPGLGLRQIRRVEDRPAVDLHDYVPELDQLVFLVVADLARPQLPGRRRARIVAAEVARRIDAPPQLESIAVDAPRRIAPRRLGTRPARCGPAGGRRPRAAPMPG